MTEISVVFDNKTFKDKLVYIVKELKTSYKNTLPFNCGYYDGAVYSFDCWNLIKALIWGWEDTKIKGYYCFKPDKNGMGDWNGKEILNKCTRVTTDFTYAEIGEYLITEDFTHAGIYIGEYEYEGNIFNVVECTPIWFGGVQFSWVDTLGKRKRNKNSTEQYGSWKYHGILPWVEYKYKDEKGEKKKKEKEEKIRLVQENYCRLYLDLAQQIIDGKWGNGSQRKKSLNSCGYDYKYAQSLVDIKLE